MAAPRIRKKASRSAAPPVPPGRDEAGKEAGSAAPPPSVVRCSGCRKIAFPYDKNGYCPSCANEWRLLQRQKRLTEVALTGQSEITDKETRKPKPPPPPSDEEIAADNVLRWRAAPWVYVQEILHAVPDAWQDEVLHAVVGLNVDGTPLPPDQPYDKLALKACKGPGKTTVLAWIILWFMTCFVDPKVICTSITAENLRDNLWTELAKWIAVSEMLTALFEWQTERVYLKERPETWYCSARTWPKDADKTKQANTLAGIHATNTLLVLDESGDIPEGVLAAGLAHHSTVDPTGQLHETHITLQAGNPTSLDGALGIACTRDAKMWWHKSITGDPDDPKRAPRISVEWARQQIATWGADNPWVLVNVFGKFPPVSVDKLLGPDHIRAAMELQVHAATWRGQPRIMALDVARSTTRDRSALCRRQGSVVFPFHIYRLADSNDLAGQVAFEFSRWPADTIIVDAVGIGGPVADFLRALGLPIVMFYGGNPARDPRFKDRRTEVAWAAAQEIKGTGGAPKLALPRQATDLVSEATAPLIKWLNGRMKLESKEEMLKRGVPSPDVWDSLCMTYAEPALVVAPNIGRSVENAIHQRTKMAVEYDPFAESHEAAYAED
jgi:phage terminase large subunit